MSSWFRKMGRYERLIQSHLSRHRLPRDLIYVAMIESGFNPKTLSYAGASGLWQFMPLGGRIYGLNATYWLDERRNPERSTRSAMYYLKDLFHRFGDWPLALAAYNAGYGAVVRAVRKYNTNDYWKLVKLEAGLPYGTTHYVPKLLAVAIAGHNPKLFGLDNVKPDPPVSFEVLPVRPAIHLSKIARAAGTSFSVVRELNPELLRDRVPPSYTTFQIRLPLGSKKRYLAKAAALGLLRRHARVYTVRFGDDLHDLAKRFNLSANRLRRHNKIRTDSELRPGLVILLPSPTPEERKGKAVAPARPAAKTKAKSLDTPPPLVKPPSAKSPKAEKTKPLVALPATSPSAPRSWRQVFYRVVAGDTLDGLALALSLRREELVSWNNLNPEAKLVPKMMLRIFVRPGVDLSRVRTLSSDQVKTVVVGSLEFHTLTLARHGMRRIIYKARRGDTMKRISRRFGLSIGSIARQNRINRNSKLKPGQKLVLYVEMKRTGRKGHRGRQGVVGRKRIRRYRPRSRSSRRSAKRTRRNPGGR